MTSVTVPDVEDRSVALRALTVFAWFCAAAPFLTLILAVFVFRFPRIVEILESTGWPTVIAGALLNGGFWLGSAVLLEKRRRLGALVVGAVTLIGLVSQLVAGRQLSVGMLIPVAVLVAAAGAWRELR